MALKLGSAGAKLITEIEELRLESYDDGTGTWTIGYGTTRLNGSSVSKGMKINELVAWALFYGDCQDRLDHIDKFINVELNQNQIDALVSFSYNLGKTALFQSSLRTAINSNQPINEDLFTRWNKARVNGILTPLAGLTRRRKAEYKLFMSKEGI